MREYRSEKLPSCAPTEIRTPVLGLKGPRPGPLDDGGKLVRAAFYHAAKGEVNFVVDLVSIYGSSAQYYDARCIAV